VRASDVCGYTGVDLRRSFLKERSILLAGKGKLVVGSGFHLYDVFGLAAKSLKEIPPLGLE